MHSATLLATLAFASSSLACKTVGGIRFTNYGFPDASGTPAYHCDGGRAVPSQPGQKTLLGDGSRNKPYAAAAARGSNTFKECSVIYIPLLEKYFKIQDDCGQCMDSSRLLQRLVRVWCSHGIE